MACTQLIKNRINGMTGTQQKLGAYLIENKAGVIHMSVKEYAAKCGCSSAAVVRFAKELGYAGYAEMKLDLARDNTEQTIDDSEDIFRTAIRENDDMVTIVKKARLIHAQNTDLTFSMINPALLEDAVKVLCNAKSINLFGVGASGLSAMDFQQKVSRIGIHANYHIDAHTSVASASLLADEDCVIAISYSGATRETVLAAKTAKERGASLISITQANRNPLSRMADYPLFVPAEEKELRIGAITSRISTLYILDLLYMGIAKNDPSATQESLEDTLELIKQLKV